MTLEKLQELMQTRMDYFGQHLSDETVTAQLKAYTANLGSVPDKIAEAAFYAALGKCRYQNQFLADWQEAIREIQLQALPSPERMWENALDTAARMQEAWEVSCIGVTDGAGTHHGGGKAAIQKIFDSQPEAVRNYYGTPATQIKALTHSSRSELARNRYRGFTTAMTKAPVKALQPPKTAPQIEQGAHPAAQISDGSKTA